MPVWWLISGLIGIFFLLNIDLNTYAIGCAVVTVGGLIVAVIQRFL